MEGTVLQGCFLPSTPQPHPQLHLCHLTSRKLSFPSKSSSTSLIMFFSPRWVCGAPSFSIISFSSIRSMYPSRPESYLWGTKGRGSVLIIPCIQEHLSQKRNRANEKTQSSSTCSREKLYNTDYIKLREVVGHFQSCLFQEGSTQKLKPNHPTQKEEELAYLGISIFPLTCPA